MAEQMTYPTISRNYQQENIKKSMKCSKYYTLNPYIQFIRQLKLRAKYVMCDKIMSTLHHDVLYLYGRVRQVQIDNLVIQSYCVTVVLVLCVIK